MKGELLFDEVRRINNQRKNHDIKKLLVRRQSALRKGMTLRSHRIKNQLRDESYKKFNR